jgi:hypothetical protein
MTEKIKELKAGETIQSQIKMNLVQIIPSPDPVYPEIDIVRYSNQIMVNVSESEVMMDFLEMPGVALEGKMHVRGTRIYVSFDKAKKMRDILNKLLKEVE